jgi:hypothetical protein
VPWTKLATFIAPVRERSSDASIPRSETVEKPHVQLPDLPFQVASIRTPYECCACSGCFGIRQITPNCPNDVAGCSGSERKNSTGLPVASVSFAETPMTLCEAQQSIDELLSRHPHDDCESVPGFLDWDARCRKALGDLQKLSARSFEGLRAKAEALVDPKLAQSGEPRKLCGHLIPCILNRD